jgi:protein phosphatase
VASVVDPKVISQAPTLEREDAGLSAAPSILRVTSCGISDTGRVRERNEDQYVIAEIRRVLRIRHSSLPQPTSLMGDRIGHLLVVADGMGGHQGGVYASALAVASVENIVLNTIGWLFRQPSEGVLAEFQEALRTTDRWVTEAAQRQPELKGMGTTLTVAYVIDNILYVAHVGDSRCYRFRGGQLQRLTRDHTFVEALVSEGIIAPEEARHHRMRNVVTNAIGGDTHGVTPEVHKHAIEPGDIILLCSDGLSEMLSDEEIAARLGGGGAPEPEVVCRTLVDRANAAGGTDNITVVVARFDRQGHDDRKGVSSPPA